MRFRIIKEYGNYRVQYLFKLFWLIPIWCYHREYVAPENRHPATDIRGYNGIKVFNSTRTAEKAVRRLMGTNARKQQHKRQVIKEYKS